jgi:hypothetical protein
VIQRDLIIQMEHVMCLGGEDGTLVPKPVGVLILVINSILLSALVG